MDAAAWLLAGILGPLFWWVTLSLILWLIRRFAPSWEKPLFRKWPDPTDLDTPTARQPSVPEDHSAPRKSP